MKANQIEVQFNPRRKVNVMSDEEPRNYEIEAKEYLSHLNQRTQRVAIKAIQDVLALGRDWRWIATALTKKGYSTWEEWKFGLWFNKEFDKSVRAAIQREDEAEKLDLEEFFSNYDIEYQYEFPKAEATEETKIIIKDVNTTLYDEFEEDKPSIHWRYAKYQNPHKEPYSSSIFEYPEYILEDIVFEDNLPAIRYALSCNDIPQEFIAIYEEALSNYAGDVNE